MTAPDDIALVDRVIARARKAQLAFEASGSQERYDQAAQAVGWAIMEPKRNRALAELAVQTTGQCRR
jgi:sulfoacetaldehyde dehydrogenase